MSTPTTFWGMPWFVWGIVCLIIAAIYARIWPRPVDRAALRPYPRLQFFVLRWFHALVWVLLALSSFLWSLTQPGLSTLAGSVAFLGLVCYIAFIWTFLSNRRAGR